MGRKDVQQPLRAADTDGMLDMAFGFLMVAVLGYALCGAAKHSAEVRRAQSHEHAPRQGCEFCRTDTIDRYLPGYFTAGGLLMAGGGFFGVLALLDALWTVLGLA